MPRGTRTRRATGIYQDTIGHSIVVFHEGASREYRYPADKSLAWLMAERQRRLAALHQTIAREATHDASLDADVPRFVATLPSPSRRRDAAALLHHWSAVFGDRPRNDLTTPELSAQLATWAQIDPATHKPRFSPASRRHLRQVLSALYRTLNGKNGYNPVLDVPAVRVIYDEPRSIPYALIKKILANMGDTQNAARASVMAYTGLPQAQLKRLMPRDVDLRRRTMYVRPRRKGGGAPAATFQLLPQAVTAFKVFAKRDCWGPFSSSSLAKAWRAAVTAVQETWKGPWPVDTIRAYDLRHSFLTEMLSITGDYHAVNELAQHSTMNQTKRYTQGAASRRVQLAIAAASGVFGTGTNMARSKNRPKKRTRR